VPLSPHQQLIGIDIAAKHNIQNMASHADDTNPAAAADANPQLSPTSPTSPTSPPSAAEAAAARLHRPILQSLPDTRQQSFDEIYGPPENFLEIEVRRRPTYLPICMHHLLPAPHHMPCHG
jgi:hypothetical protein